MTGASALSQIPGHMDDPPILTENRKDQHIGT